MAANNQITLLLGQKIKHPFIKEALLLYAQKLRPYASFNIVESKTAESFREQSKKLQKETLTIVLDEKGRQFNSQSFSKTWETLTTQKVKGISFIVGGPYGFESQPQCLPPRSDLTLSLSNLTLNYELVPLVLVEQVYRAYTILQGLPYHHA